MNHGSITKHTCVAVKPDGTVAPQTTSKECPKKRCAKIDPLDRQSSGVCCHLIVVAVVTFPHLSARQLSTSFTAGDMERRTLRWHQRVRHSFHTIPVKMTTGEIVNLIQKQFLYVIQITENVTGPINSKNNRSRNRYNGCRFSLLLFFSLFLFTYLSQCLSVFTCLSPSLHVSLSLLMSVSLSSRVCLPLFTCLSPSLYMSVTLSLHVSLSSHVGPSLSSCLCLFISISTSSLFLSLFSFTTLFLFSLALSSLSVRQSLTCRESQSARALAHSSVGELLAPCRKNLYWCSVVCGCGFGGCYCCCVLWCCVCRGVCCVLWCGLWRPSTEIHGYSCRWSAIVLNFLPR